jgi:hypothetical protein
MEVGPSVAASGLRGDQVARGFQLLLAVHDQGPGEISPDIFAHISSADLAAQFAIGTATIAWDDLTSFALPILALGNQEVFLITCVIGNVARVHYPLLGELMLLRPWVEERWSGNIAFVDPSLALRASKVG